MNYRLTWLVALVARRLQAMIESAREDLGDSRRHIPGKNVRPVGRVATTRDEPIAPRGILVGNARMPAPTERAALRQGPDTLRLTATAGGP